MFFFLFCLCLCRARYEIPDGMSQMFEIMKIKTNLNFIYQLISVYLSLFWPEPTTQVTSQAPSPLSFFLKPRTAPSSSSSRPALPTTPPKPASALLQSGLPWQPSARREQGALRGEQFLPGQEPQGQLPPPRADWVQLACVCFAAGGGCTVHPWAAGHQTWAERTHLYPRFSHQDAKSQWPEGDRAVNPPPSPNHTTSNTAPSWKHLSDADIVVL